MFSSSRINDMVAGWLRFIVITLLIANLSACATWQTYDSSYDASKGVATLHQTGFKSSMIWVAQVDDVKKGWGAPSVIELSPGVHLIGFEVNLFFYTLIPTDPNEKYNSWSESVNHWIKFTAKANTHYEIRSDLSRSRVRVVIVEKSTGKVCSEPIGNYVHVPEEYLDQAPGK